MKKFWTQLIDNKLKMHILFIPFSYPNVYNHSSGIFFEEQARALILGGNKVNVIALIGVSVRSIFNKKRLALGFNSYVKNGISVFMYSYLSVPKLPRLNNLMRLSFGKRVFRKYVKENGRPDLLHVHVSDSGELALWVREKYNIPYIITEHSSASLTGVPRPEWQECSLKRIYSNAIAVMSVSYKLKESIDNKYKIDSIVVPNTVDTDFFSLNENKENDVYTFLNIANFNKNKNQEMLVEAFKEAYQKKCSYKLIIAGGGEQKSKLQDLVKRYDLADQITLLDLVSREDVKRLIDIADCLILTSYMETFGVVLIEAMSSGLPLISTRSGGPEDIIKNSKLGLLCDVSVQSIKTAIQNIHKTTFDRQYIRQHAIENYSYAVFSKLVSDIYKRVV